MQYSSPRFFFGGWGWIGEKKKKKILTSLLLFIFFQEDVYIIKLDLNSECRFNFVQLTVTSLLQSSSILALSNLLNITVVCSFCWIPKTVLCANIVVFYTTFSVPYFLPTRPPSRLGLENMPTGKTPLSNECPGNDIKLHLIVRLP